MFLSLNLRIGQFILNVDRDGRNSGITVRSNQRKCYEDVCAKYNTGHLCIVKIAIYMCVCVCVCLSVCLCVFVCMRERKRETSCQNQDTVKE